MTSSNFDTLIKSTNVRDFNIKLVSMNIAFSLAHAIFPKSTLNFLKKRFFKPASKPLNSQQAKWHNKDKQIDIPFNKMKFKAWKIGSGPAILFTHGWNGRGVQFQYFFKEFLDAGYSVIFYDAPAHGNSNGEMTNYYEMTACLKAIFQYEFEDEIVGIVAHSMGASVIINYLHDNPKFMPLVFIAPALSLLELLFKSFQSHGVPKHIFFKLMWEFENQYQIPLATRNPIDLIKRLNNQILIIHDSDDKITSLEDSTLIEKNMLNVNLIETEGLGHNRLLKDLQVSRESLNFIYTRTAIMKAKQPMLIQ
jgi:hypothetical protein